MSRLSNDDPRRHVQVLEERIGSVANTDFPGHYPGEDHEWNLDTFKQVRGNNNLQVAVN